MVFRYFSLAALALCALTPLLNGQDAGAAKQTSETQPAAAAPPPASTPAVTGPLHAAPPIAIGGEKIPGLIVNGAVSGMGLLQDNHSPGDKATQATLSNGQVFLQKTTGWWQFYVQAGIYDIPALGTPFLSAENTATELFGPVPVAYLKLVPGKNTSILVGSLPTLMGAESTFTFQNMNIARGLLWNQENAVNRGIQVNEMLGKFSASLSWNDGFYSNRYSWLSGALSYSSGPHSVAVQAMRNLGQTAFQTLATPVQNNSKMYTLIYTYMQGNWIFQPYVQYSGVPRNLKAGILKGASTIGGALLVDRSLRRGFSIAGRVEYLAATGSSADGAVNLLYGPGSAAFSATLTPTLQRGRFFVRADLSLVRASGFLPGYAFGLAGSTGNQLRGLVETGFLF